MENEQNRLVLLAEDVLISEQSKLNPVFLTIDVKLCDSELNKNGEGVTEAFIADVVQRTHDFDCLPFYADVQNLLAGNYEKLGHLYNRVLRTFGTKMIGSMTGFYSATDANGVTSLYGKIRIPKREKEVCLRLVDLYEQGHFAVSFEVTYDARELILKDGGKFIDASENSSLTGLCLVWNPACEDAYAFDLVAEHSEDIVAESEERESERGEKDNMNENEIVVSEEMTAEAEEVKTPEAEEIVAEENTEVAAAEDQKPEEEGEEAGNEQPEAEDDEEKMEETQAEVLCHTVETRESVENWGGDPIHTVEVTERVVETLEEANRTIAEQKDQIAEMEHQIAELKEIEAKYNAMIAEAEEKALAEKRVQARAFAEKQGLNAEDTAVAEAIEKLDYAKIAELTMAQAETAEEPQPEPEQPRITLASFVEMEVGSDQYGGLLNRRNK